MKKRKKSIIIIALIIISIIINIYQFSSNNKLKNELHNLEANNQELIDKNNAQDAELGSKKESLADLSSQLSELQSTIEDIKVDNQNLSERLEELKATKEADKETLEANNSDNSLADSDREFLDSIWERLEKENPELFANPSPGTGATNKSPDYISVDGPVDNGVIPEFDMNAVTSDVAPGTVY